MQIHSQKSPIYHLSLPAHGDSNHRRVDCLALGVSAGPPRVLPSAVLSCAPRRALSFFGGSSVATLRACARTPFGARRERDALAVPNRALAA